ncbi:erythromycin esterase family protein [Kribbella italica]|uniref:Erythromycin esterase-like protein n=1 Tax=Kribbella italica TaxID=1540520 RepID=A0A7W9J3Q6_9ACTN|nr:erythromycin esterase family protein [Kribbella italica]MBB5834815.1 erythromycin esterase-like protein [Kribbella italica]
MRQDLQELATGPCELLAIGEPAHPTQDASFGPIRNELFESLVQLGFRSIALETDRVAALAVDGFVRDGIGSLDAVMTTGFSHGFGAVEANRQLVGWMRQYNEGRPVEERLSFHGFDAPTESTSAPSPRAYLEHVLDYLGDLDGLDRGRGPAVPDLDLAGLLGPDDRWSRQEAILDSAMSIGATAEAVRLRAIADDLLTTLYTRAPELIAATSRADWYRARVHATAALGLLRYHQQAAQQTDETARISGLLAVRDVIMAQNLLDIRTLEDRRGRTLVCAQNAHLQRNRSTLQMGGMTLTWHSAGAILSSLNGDRYAVVISTLDPTGIDRTTVESADAILPVVANAIPPVVKGE